MRNKTRKNQRGGTVNTVNNTLQFENMVQNNQNSHKFRFYARAPIPRTIRNKVKANKANRNTFLRNLAKPRNLAFAEILFPGDEIFALYITALNTKLRELGIPILNERKTVELAWLRNIDEKTINNNAEKGTLITREKVINFLNESAYEGPAKLINLNKPAHISRGNAYFLQKGTGGLLLRYVLDYLRNLRDETNGSYKIDSIFLKAGTNNLVHYYRNFGFTEVRDVTIEPWGYTVGTPDGSDPTAEGPMMYLRFR
jgi:hypothetical protein